MESEIERIETNIENSASQYIGKNISDQLDEKDKIAADAYMAGVKSAVSKEYWLHKTTSIV